MSRDNAFGQQRGLCENLHQAMEIPSRTEQVALARFVPRRLFCTAKETSFNPNRYLPTLSARSDRALAKWLQVMRKTQGVLRVSATISGRLRFITVMYRLASEICRNSSSVAFLEKALIYGAYTTTLDRKKGMIEASHYSLAFLPHAIQRACERGLMVCREKDDLLLQKVDQEACNVHDLISTQKSLEVIHAPSGPGAWVCRPTDNPEEWHVRTYLSEHMLPI